MNDRKRVEGLLADVPFWRELRMAYPDIYEMALDVVSLDKMRQCAGGLTAEFCTAEADKLESKAKQNLPNIQSMKLLKEAEVLRNRANKIKDFKELPNPLHLSPLHPFAGGLNQNLCLVQSKTKALLENGEPTSEALARALFDLSLITGQFVGYFRDGKRLFQTATVVNVIQEKIWGNPKLLLPFPEEDFLPDSNRKRWLEKEATKAFNDNGIPYPEFRTRRLLLYADPIKLKAVEDLIRKCCNPVTGIFSFNMETVKDLRRIFPGSVAVVGPEILGVHQETEEIRKAVQSNRFYEEEPLYYAELVAMTYFTGLIYHELGKDRVETDLQVPMDLRTTGAAVDHLLDLSMYPDMAKKLSGREVIDERDLALQVARAAGAMAIYILGSPEFANLMGPALDMVFWGLFGFERPIIRLRQNPSGFRL